MWKHDQSGHSIQGQLLRLSTHREVAIYLRNGSVWVADFVAGRGVLSAIVPWLRMNCGTAANLQAARRAVLESAVPLSMELAARIEALHEVNASAAHSDVKE